MEQQWETKTAKQNGITTIVLPEIPGPENQQEIAALAHQYWLARGCPEGTPEEDWFRAEREIATSRETNDQELGNQSSAELETVRAARAEAARLRFPVRSEVFRASVGWMVKKA